MAHLDECFVWCAAAEMPETTTEVRVLDVPAVISLVDAFAGGNRIIKPRSESQADLSTGLARSHLSPSTRSDLAHLRALARQM